MKEFFIEQPRVVARLVHESTKSVFLVYKPINWFQRLMIKWCFGFKYEKVISDENK